MQRPVRCRPTTWLLLAPVLLMAGCSSGSSDPVNRFELSLVGTVTSSVGGAPIPNATVQLQRGGVDCLPILEISLGGYTRPEPSSVALATVVSALRRRTPRRDFPSCFSHETDLTDAAGRFRITHLEEVPPGNDCDRLFLSVWADGFVGRYGSNGQIQCTEAPQTFNFELAPGGVPFSLSAPPDGARILQNDPTTGCAEHPTRGFGHGILFDWTDAQGLGGMSYRIRVETPEAVRALDLVVTESEYSYVRCDFVPDAILTGWQWRVRFEGGGQVSEWSPVRSFDFEPCRLSGGTPCS